MSDFSYEIGRDNIAVIKWDVPNKKFNVLTIEGIDEIEKILNELFENNGLKGVIIASNKDNFSLFSIKIFRKPTARVRARYKTTRWSLYIS